MINGGATYTGSVSVSLTLSADDGAGSGVADMRFSNDNATWSDWQAYTTIWDWTLIGGNGLKTVYVQYRDEVGNVSTGVISDTITLDTSLPSCDAITPTTPNPTGGTTVAFSVGFNKTVVNFDTVNDLVITKTDSLAYSTVTISGGGQAYTAVFTGITGDGSLQIAVSTSSGVQDLASTALVSSVSSEWVVVDHTGPSGTLVINEGEMYANSLLATLTLSADDGTGCGVADMQFSNDNATWSGWEPYGTSKSWGLASGNGVRTVFVQYRDGVGNVSSALISDTIILDTAEPVFTGITATPATAVMEDEVTLMFHASEPLIAEPSVTVNGHAADHVSGKDGADYVYSYTVLDPSQDPIGPAEIEITGEDLAGNFGAVTDSSALIIEEKNTVPAASLPILLVLTGLCAAAGGVMLRNRR